MKIVLSPQATKSIASIKRYTDQNFGKQQTSKYVSMLRSKIDDVAAKPSLGQQRDEIKSGYYSVIAGKHCIYYRVSEQRIDVLDILHQSMDPYRHL